MQKSSLTDSLLTVTLLAVDGPPLRESIHDGQRYFGGQLGQRYMIKIKNQLHHRVCTVVTVDGRNIIDGNSSAFEGSGYVQHAALQCEGWRTSDNSVAAFRLTTKSSSYAALQGGTTEDVGIIRVAIFQSLPANPIMRSSSYSYENPESFGPMTRSAAGTGFGEAVHSPCTHTTFRRESSPTVHTINYSTIDDYIAAGIMTQTSPSTSPYCKPPATATIA